MGVENSNMDKQDVQDKKEEFFSRKHPVYPVDPC